jgi:hypothetical protein
MKYLIFMLFITIAVVTADAYCNKQDPNMEKLVKLKQQLKDKKLVPISADRPWIMLTQKQKNYYDLTGRLP